MEIVTKRTKFSFYKLDVTILQMTKSAVLLETENKGKKFTAWLPINVLIPSRKSATVYNLADDYIPRPNSEVQVFLSMAKEVNKK
jgi:hypothetical protein